MAEPLVLLPGDSIDSSLLPQGQKRKLGHGVSQSQNGNDYTVTVAGTLQVDHKKKLTSITNASARYIPRIGDNVIAQVRGASFETFHLYITPHGVQGMLNHFAFEGASKKTRPQLKNGDLVYAKVVSTIKGMDVELSCVNPSTGKADGLGPLTDGNVFDVSKGLCDRMLKKELQPLMEELGTKVPGGFELVVGKNGRIWVDSQEGGIRGILAVGRVLQRVDEEGSTEEQWKKLVKQITKELGLG